LKKDNDGNNNELKKADKGEIDNNEQIETENLQ